MANVGIITDSICCLPLEIMNEFGIRLVALPMSLDGKSYQDQVDITPEAFWKLFPTMKEFTTGAPPVGQIVEAFKTLGQSSSDICCITVSRQLSATYDKIAQARELVRAENPGLNIEMVDSRNAAGAQGFVVLEAARAARAGKSLAEVSQVANNMVPRVGLLCAMETLKYLIKSGRAPKTAYIGELFQVKPLIGLVNNTGLVENMGRARGKRNAVARLLDLMEEYTHKKPIHVNVHYTDSIEDGEQLKKLVTSRFDCRDVYFTPYTPVMSGHTGPVLALCFYAEEGKGN